MTRSFSIYLDFLRFFAAFLVLLFHSGDLYRTGLTIFSFGPEAVIIFFVLSGFVIAYVADTKELTLKHYAISRMARIYSVAIPAIILTAALDFTGFSINAIAYPEGKQAWDYAPIRVLSSLSFTNEIWNLSIQLFSNVPYWSLNYEVWYYIGFAVLTFVKGQKRWAIFTGICFFTGPKIILLMPLWWLGVYIYKSERFRDISKNLSIVLLAFSILGIYMYIKYNIGNWGWNLFENLVGKDLHKEFTFSRHFISDYYFGLVIAMHFVAVRGLCDHFLHIFDSVERPIRLIAGSTFSLYLLHQPLLIFFHSIFYFENHSLKTYILILVATVITAFLISLITEQKKFIWRRWITNIFEFIEVKFTRMHSRSS
tara:strand:+ start:1526 stop:2632 length:1107 start_codon:yes stop_codon:yes gene_type:complete